MYLSFIISSQARSSCRSNLSLVISIFLTAYSFIDSSFHAVRHFTFHLDVLSSDFFEEIDFSKFSTFSTFEDCFSIIISITSSIGSRLEATKFTMKTIKDRLFLSELDFKGSNFVNTDFSFVG